MTIRFCYLKCICVSIWMNLHADSSVNRTTKTVHIKALADRHEPISKLNGAGSSFLPVSILLTLQAALLHFQYRFYEKIEFLLVGDLWAHQMEQEARLAAHAQTS